MDEWVLRLLEHSAIRYETAMDYKAWQELVSSGAAERLSFPDLKDLMKINSSGDRYALSGRTKALVADSVKDSDKVRRAVDKYVKLTEDNNIHVIAKGSEYYPRIWEFLNGMPPVLFVKGDIRTLLELDYYGAASIVGSRSPGRYSIYATREFSSELCKRKVVIVSGMAMGIDRQAHEACLEAGGRTLAVMPGGCDVIYPYQNCDIYDLICGKGAILSELPPGQEIIKQYFPSRNRLISALSDVCMIMEAGMHSGTLHTASFAAAQGRDVFVLPNSIYAENSIGGLLLLKDGAEVLIDVNTVYERIKEQVGYRIESLPNRNELSCSGKPDIEMLRNMSKACPDKIDESGWKELICDEISERPKNIDELCISLGIPFSYLSSLVTGLETEGRVASERGKYVLTIHGR